MGPKPCCLASPENCQAYFQCFRVVMLPFSIFTLSDMTKTPLHFLRLIEKAVSTDAYWLQEDLLNGSEWVKGGRGTGSLNLWEIGKRLWNCLFPLLLLLRFTIFSLSSWFYFSDLWTFYQLEALVQKEWFKGLSWAEP